MPGNQSAQFFLDACERIQGILSTPSTPSEVRFFEMGRFVRYCFEFASEVDRETYKKDANAQ
jgi:hypothetical protein